ncbi:MAG: MFS transporter [Algicola sp.]|nr:MFS transporter [Algicola sp.]
MTSSKMPLFILTLSRFLDRFCYWGFRSFLVFFLIESFDNNGLGLSQLEALALYGLFTTFIFITPVIGGLIADFLLSKRTVAILGLVVFSAGVLGLTLTTGVWLNVHFFVIALGLGLFGPNNYALIAQLPANSDSSFTLLELMSSVGALLAPIIMWLVVDEQNWHRGYYLIALLAGLNVMLLFFGRNCIVCSPTDKTENNPVKIKQLAISWVFVVAAALIYLLYWAVYEGMYPVIEQTRQLVTHMPALPQFLSFISDPQQLLPMVGVPFYVIGALLLALLWFKVPINRWIKLAIALFLYALSWQLIGYSGQSADSTNLLTLVVMAEVLFVFSDLLLSPILLSLIGQYSTAKGMSTSFGLFALFGGGLNYATGMMAGINDAHLGTIVITCLLMSFAMVGAVVIIKKRGMAQINQS